MPKPICVGGADGQLASLDTVVSNHGWQFIHADRFKDILALVDVLQLELDTELYLILATGILTVIFLLNKERAVLVYEESDMSIGEAEIV